MTTEWDELSALADEYGPEGWLINHGVFGGFDAYLGEVGPPPMVLHDRTPSRLGERVAEFRRVWDASPHLAARERRDAAERAANDLET